MATLDDFAGLAGKFVDAFNNGVAGGTGGADLYMRLNTLGAYNGATQKRASTPTTTTAITRYSRTRGVVFNAPSAAGAQRKFEEFSVVVVIADALAKGWPSAAHQPDETTQLLIGVDGAEGIFPVISCERVMKEQAWRMKVRRDLGPAT